MPKESIEIQADEVQAKQAEKQRALRDREYFLLRHRWHWYWRVIGPIRAKGVVQQNCRTAKEYKGVKHLS